MNVIRTIYNKIFKVRNLDVIYLELFHEYRDVIELCNTSSRSKCKAFQKCRTGCFMNGKIYLRDYALDTSSKEEQIKTLLHEIMHHHFHEEITKKCRIKDEERFIEIIEDLFDKFL